MTEEHTREVVVIGAGPGGYAAAFMAADLGLDTTLIDPEEQPGGVCLYRGCIPSKALLHIARLRREAMAAGQFGLNFSDPEIDLEKIRNWKDEVIGRLTGGLKQLTKRRDIRYLQGMAEFVDPHTLEVKTEEGEKKEIRFEHAIIATGSRPQTIPGIASSSDKIIFSDAALNIESIPEKLLVVGGGYIGLEMSTVYNSLGAEVSIVEMTPDFLPGTDPDLIKVFKQENEALFEESWFETKVTAMEEKEGQVLVTFEKESGETEQKKFDKVLLAVGREPLTAELGLEHTAVEVDEHGFIRVNAQRQTDEASIYAIGDVTGAPLLAHKATHEGRVAAEAIAGKTTAYEPRAIPAVVYTDPEIAWCGLSETQAEKNDKKVKVARFRWSASGRAATLGKKNGLTKLIIDPETDRILGVGIAGKNAGDLIPEAVLAVEMAALASDIALSIHPHPTLSETIMEAAEAYYGHPTHVFRG